MSKVNPNRYAVPIVPAETRDFPETLQPGVVLTISLRPITGFTAFSEFMKLAGELKKKYVTGFEQIKDDGTKEEIKPAIVIDSQGAIIPINEHTAEMVAQLLSMQAGPEEDIYNAYEWLQNSGVFPNAFLDIVSFALELNGDEEEDADEKKSPMSEEPCSAPISEPQEHTPALPSDKTPSLLEPTADSVS